MALEDIAARKERRELGLAAGEIGETAVTSVTDVLVGSVPSKDKKAKVKAFTFLFSTWAGRWTSLRMGPERIAEVEASIPGLLKILKEGSFKQTANKKECEYLLSQSKGLC